MLTTTGLCAALGLAWTAAAICSDAVSEPPGEETRNTMALTSLVLGSAAWKALAPHRRNRCRPWCSVKPWSSGGAGDDIAFRPDQGDHRSRHRREMGVARRLER